MRHRGRKTLDMGSAQEFRAHSFPGCCSPCGRALKSKNHSDLIPLPYLRSNACTYAALALRFSLPEPLRKENIAIAAVAKKTYSCRSWNGRQGEWEQSKEGREQEKGIILPPSQSFYGIKQENRYGGWMSEYSD